LFALLSDVISSVWIVTKGVASKKKSITSVDWCFSISEDVVVSKIVSENERSNSGKFNKNVNSWTRGIFKWITDGITNNRSNVVFSELSISCHPFFKLFKLFSVKALINSSFNFVTEFINFSSELECNKFVVLNSHLFKINTSILSFLSEFSLVSLNFFLGIIPSTT